MMRTSLIRLLVPLLLAVFAPAGAEAEPPADSLYHLSATFTDQTGAEFDLADEAGKPVLVAMFYTSCQYVCPLIVDGLKQLERSLAPDERERLRIVLVSFDSAHDDTQALAKVAAQRKLDPARWRLARTGAGEVRQLAALLGVRYRPLADGGFNHTSQVTLLDREGRAIASAEATAAVKDRAFVAKLRETIAE